ncbi:DUF1264 domain-containing protein, partial [Streptomyces sp. SID5998]|nr:DUF1264 domain-containing protein [Streptomyces sp. SID5998]
MGFTDGKSRTYGSGRGKAGAVGVAAGAA